MQKEQEHVKLRESQSTIMPSLLNSLDMFEQCIRPHLLRVGIRGVCGVNGGGYTITESDADDATAQEHLLTVDLELLKGMDEPTRVKLRTAAEADDALNWALDSVQYPEHVLLYTVPAVVNVVRVAVELSTGAINTGTLTLPPQAKSPNWSDSTAVAKAVTASLTPFYSLLMALAKLEGHLMCNSERLYFEGRPRDEELVIRNGSDLTARMVELTADVRTRITRIRNIIASYMKG